MSKQVRGREVIDVIVFDFDNVIVKGSEELKKNAWSKIFDSKSIEYERYTGAQKYFGSRQFDRFDILAHALGLSEEKNYRNHNEILRLSREYDSIVQNSILEIGIDKEDLQAIQRLSERYLLYVISATPETSLRETFKSFSQLYKLDFDQYFKLILGTPLTKIDNFVKVQNHSKSAYINMLMVGDGLNDLLSARTVGSNFVGITTTENSLLWKTENFPKINSISSLEGLLV